MATYTLPITLPASSSHQAASSYGKPTAPVKRALAPVGPSFLRHVHRTTKKVSLEDDEKEVEEQAARDAAARGTGVGDDNTDIGSEPESKDLLASDPKEWKSQDHYAVLGLSALRWKATPDQIKRAHRKKVLKHHPDKKANSGDSNDDAFFKCIAKAHDILSDPTKRRQFDSVDPELADFDELDIPPAKELSSDPDKFFKFWAPVYAREIRFTDDREKAPSFGDKDSSKPEVEKFYDYWYNFDSWRSFEYLDKEANEGADSRDEKRHAERKNKAERARRKKEDSTRLRTLIDATLASDPRIKKFKADEKRAREEKRSGSKASSGTATPVKGGAGGKPLNPAQIKKAAEEARKKEEEEKKVKDAEDKVQREAAKKAREAAKKNLKRDKKAVSTVITSNNYFQPAGTSPSPQVIEDSFAELDAIVEALEPEDLGKIRKEVEADPAKGKETLTKWAASAKEKGSKREFKVYV